MINLTIVGQIIAFAVFLLFCMKFVWPPFIAAINERQRKIAEGLNAAEQARADLAMAETKVEEQVNSAKVEANAIIERAQRTANQMIEEAKTQARVEGERIVAAARATVDQQVVSAREELRRDFAGLAVLGAEKILLEKIDETKHAAMLADLAARL